MSYLVLARKWRPQTFEDVTGQEHVVQTLANAIARDRVAHAFLLCGPRGVGKTTTARLLARALNCANGPTATPCGECLPCKEITQGNSVDVAEIDGASNNGVDNIRELREAARYLPQRDRHKIFIIDEVHMLSVGAFNALLKTLEEPPPHVKFIFATTDPQKLPETILSRCQRHNFRRVTLPKMVERLRRICEGEGIVVSDRALSLVARQADGGMRDALSLLDQLISSAGLEVSDAAVEEALGLVDRTTVLALAEALLARDGAAVLAQVAAVHDRGVELKKLCEELAFAFRDLVYVKATGDAPADRSDAERKQLVGLAGQADHAQLARIFDLVHGAIRDVSYAAQPRLALEVALLTAVHLAPARGLADLAARLESIAATLGAGGAVAQGPAVTAASAPAMAPPAPAPASGGSSRPPAASAPARPAYARQPITPPAGDDLAARVASMARSGRAPAPREAATRPAPAAPAEDKPRRPQASPTPAVPPRRPAPVAVPAPPPFDDEPPPPGDDDAPPMGFEDEGAFEAPRAAPAPRFQAPSAGPAAGARYPAPTSGPGAPSRFQAPAGGPAAPRYPPVPAPPAARASRGPAPAPAAPAVDLAPGDDPTLDTADRWRKAIAAVRGKRPLLAMHLAEGRLLWLRPGEAAVGFTPEKKFHRGQLDAREAEALLSAWFGAPLALRVQDAAADAPTSVAEDRRRELEERARRLRAEAEGSPAVQAVKDILGGEIEEIRVLEEE